MRHYEILLKPLIYSILRSDFPFRYIYSFYVATKMATSIGNLPHATNSLEFIFMTVYWLSGVYISAILIGQVSSHI